MADLFLPPGIRYTCLRCGACCRRLEVTLTEAEHERLLAHDWAGALPGFAPDRSFARIRGARGKQVWRLRPGPTGACRFLTEGNLCLVHAMLGPAAKPFAGRLFPFTFAVTPVGVFVGCRFSCPAVVRGEGQDLESQRRDIERLFDEYARVYDPPRERERVRFIGRYEIGWRDAVRLEDQLIAFLLMRNLEIPRRLLACRRVVRRFASGAVSSRAEDSRVGVEPDEILAEMRAATKKAEGLSGTERVMMRLLAATFVGAALPSFRQWPLARRLGKRLSNLHQRFLMALGRGRVLLPGLAEAVPIREVGAVGAAALDARSSAMLERYLVAKIAGQAFFGRSFFRRSFVEGVDFLASAYGAIVWLAGGCALAAGRRDLQPDDIEYGIRQVDEGFNYLPSLGGTLERMRGILFWHWATPEKLLAALSHGD